MSNELQDFIAVNTKTKASNEKVYYLEFSILNDNRVTTLSALENHLFYHLKEFTNKARKEETREGVLEGDTEEIAVIPTDRLLSGEDYVIVPK